ncbi:hypothetical protein JTB14_031822 [Gonioctena quinquepunctata]|nr:hypothetical protein JTB14_031822 [Gonioctena quinquepunctata]
MYPFLSLMLLLLQNSHEFKGKNIFVTNDLSQEDQVIHKVLRGHLNTAKRSGIKASIRHNHLVINEFTYSIDHLSSNPNLLQRHIPVIESVKRKELASSKTSLPKKPLRENPPIAAKLL